MAMSPTFAIRLLAIASLVVTAFMYGALDRKIRNSLSSISVETTASVNEAAGASLASIMRQEMVDLLEASKPSILGPDEPVDREALRNSEMYQAFERKVFRSMIATRVIEIKVIDRNQTNVYSSENLVAPNRPNDRAFADALYGKVSTHIEQLRVNPDRGDLTVTTAATYAPVYDKGGHTIGVFKIYTDISDSYNSMQKEEHDLVQFSRTIFGGLFLLALAWLVGIFYMIRFASFRGQGDDLAN